LDDQKDYSGNFVYYYQELAYILTGEGRATKETGGIFSYEYFLRDHLGNVRVTFNGDENEQAQVLQEKSFYPFGMIMGGQDYSFYGSHHNVYMYQGKEFEIDIFDLNSDGTKETQFLWHDFHTRMFDSQLGRWHVTDPLLNDASPYIGMGNNPLNLVDLNGTIPDRNDACSGSSGGIRWDKVGYFFKKIGQGISNAINSLGMAGGPGNNDPGGGPAPPLQPSLEFGSGDDYTSSGGSGSSGGGSQSLGPGGMHLNKQLILMGIDPAEYWQWVAETHLIQKSQQYVGKIKNIYNYRYQGGFLQGYNNFNQLNSWARDASELINRELNIIIFHDVNDNFSFYIQKWNDASDRTSNLYTGSAVTIAQNNKLFIWGWLHVHPETALMSGSDLSGYKNFLEVITKRMGNQYAGKPQLNLIISGSSHIDFYNSVTRDYKRKFGKDQYKLHPLRPKIDLPEPLR
jgi:RHS repeat-associated protein